MVVHKRKKRVKYRGSTTHGGGHRKKRRGAGSRGGRGNAGTGKRAGQKKAGMKDRVLGRVGFNPRRTPVVQGKAVNLLFFTPKRLDHFVQQGKVAKERDIYIVDLHKLKISKILSLGEIAVKVKVVRGVVSARAEGKIKKAGGVVESSSAPPQEAVEENESA